MLRILTLGVIGYAYFDIKTNLPHLAVPHASPLTAAVTMEVRIQLFIQIMVSGLLMLTPAIARAAPWAVHFGKRRFSDYTEEQQERVMPLLKRMTGQLGLIVSFFFAAQIHLRIHSALADLRAHPPVGTWVAGLLISSALIIAYYLQRFDEEAGGE